MRREIQDLRITSHSLYSSVPESYRWWHFSWSVIDIQQSNTSALHCVIPRRLYYSKGYYVYLYKEVEGRAVNQSTGSRYASAEGSGFESRLWHRCAPICLQLVTTWRSHWILVPLSRRSSKPTQCAIRPSDFNQHIKLMLIGFRVLKHITWITLFPQVQTDLSWEQGTGNLICSQFFWPTDKAWHRLPLGCHRLV